MIKVLKYKIINALEDKKLLIGTILYIIIFNYQIILKSGILARGNGNFNHDLKYSLMMNNFVGVAITFGLIISIYLGVSIIGKDMENKQMYILLTNVNSRKIYFFANLLGCAILILGLQFILTMNLFILAKVIDIVVPLGEILYVNMQIFMNMMILMTITAMFSIVLEGYKGALVGLIVIILFNIHTYLIIPLVNINISLNTTWRRVLMNIAPIRDVRLPSIIASGYAVDLKLPPPYMINNFLTYQVFFLILMIILSLLIFHRKDL